MDKKKNVITRLITGFALGLSFLALIIYGGVPLFLVTMFIVYFATHEYVVILRHKGFYPSLKVILIADAFFALLAYLNRFNLVPFAITVSSITAFIWVLFKGRQPYIANVATTILGFIYSGLFPLYLIFMRDIGSHPTYHYLIKTSTQYSGLGYLLLLFFGVIVTDTGGYYFGSKFGKHPLAPVISPKKTIEGSLGGALFAVLGSVIVGYFIHLPLYHSVILGLLCTIFAQLGDLSESLIKRDAGVKDSGDTLPGHGGFLDRTDIFIFTIPIMYYYLKCFIFHTEWISTLIHYVKGLF